MSAIEPLFRLFRIDCAVSSHEQLILEAEFFTQFYKGLNECFRSHYRSYFRLMKFNKEMEDRMLETSFMQNIIRDVVSTGDYTLEGIAYCTNIPEEVVREIAAGKNTNPSLHASRKIIELHRTIRLSLYQGIVRGVVMSSLSEKSHCSKQANKSQAK